MPPSPRYTVERRSLVQAEVAPVRAERRPEGILFLDFGKASFGTLLLPPAGDARQGTLVVHLGEKLAADGGIDRAPGGTIRYIRIEQESGPAGKSTRVVIPPDKRNTGPGAIPMPPEIGEVYPFRYAEIENAGGIEASAARQIRVHYPFDDGASSFDASDDILNAVWELCKYSIKATTFCGVYVDGDRERIPYEGDAYINQLSHYCVDREYAFARYTHEYLIQHPTWPTEWHLHSVMMAWADHLYTGETVSLAAFYDDLRAKTLVDLARADGLISTQSERCTRAFEERLHLHGPRYIFSRGLQDLVDWPKAGGFTPLGERDGHEMMPVNTVINAFHAHALFLMSKIAGALGREDDRLRFARQAELAAATINRLLFDPERGVYIDGEGSAHASLHSNMFMLAFGLVPASRRAAVVAFVKSRGMACSVYGAQYLLEALYLNGEDRYALDLMTARHDRGWWNMLQAGSTITMEAWDLKYKNNLDWNHAWGAAPANIIPRFLLGVRPLEPGFGKVLIQPQPGGLSRVAGIVPTPRGPVRVALQTEGERRVGLQVEIPAGMKATVGVPWPGGRSPKVLWNGRCADPRRDGRHLVLDGVESGTHEVSCEQP